MSVIRTPKLSTWDKIHRWLMRFRMCSCVDPKYQVLYGVLCCGVCRRAVEWSERPTKEKT